MRLLLAAALAAVFAGAAPVAATPVGSSVSGVIVASQARRATLSVTHAHLPARVPNPTTCDPNAGAVIICSAYGYADPYAGRVFTGGYVWVVRPAQTSISTFSCDAKVGGRLVKVRGGLGFAGGVHVRSIVRRYYTTPDASGDVHLKKATCSWRIPRWARGKLFSFVHPPADVPCEDCPGWGLHVEWDSQLAEINDVTWRVR